MGGEIKGVYTAFSVGLSNIHIHKGVMTFTPRGKDKEYPFVCLLIAIAFLKLT